VPLAEDLVASSPSLTVALPTCNGARHLAEALRSVLAQEGADFELIVSDDRSDDETVALAREAAGDRAWIEVNPERLGLAGNWNRCVERSRTPLVAVFHQDDVMRPGHLAAHLRAFRAFEGVGMACGAAEVIDAEGRPVPPSVVGRGDLGPSDRLYPPGGFVVELAASNPVRCSAVTLSKAAHADVGGFHPSFRYAVDWDFWLRLARRWPVVWLAEPTVAVRWHPASETHRFKRGTADLEEVARVLDDLHTHDAPHLPDARRLRRRADRNLARAYLNRADDALHAGDPALARLCLGRAFRLAPSILGTIARDPRLAARLALLAVSRSGT
jgi:glycosyltransferase involved in cell wall biosynthesis